MTVGSGLWLGLMTSISPRSLETNIAALSLIRQTTRKGGHALPLAQLLYALGRMLAHVVLAVLLATLLLSVSAAPNWLQFHMNGLLGLVLTLGGLLLLRLPRPQISGIGELSLQAQKLGQRGGCRNAMLLGVLSAVSFCPVSASIFLGGLLAIMVRSQHTVAITLLYALGSVVPTIVFSLIQAVGASQLGKILSAARTFEHWARPITGAAFLGAGIWFIFA